VTKVSDQRGLRLARIMTSSAGNTPAENRHAQASRTAVVTLCPPPARLHDQYGNRSPHASMARTGYQDDTLDPVGIDARFGCRHAAVGRRRGRAMSPSEQLMRAELDSLPDLALAVEEPTYG